MNISFRTLQLVVALALGSLIAGLMVGLHSLVHRRLDDRIDESLKVRAFALAFSVDPKAPRLQPYLEQGLGSVPGGCFLQLFDADGHPLGHSANLSTPLPLSEVTRRSAPARSEALVEDARGADGRPVRLATLARTDFLGSERRVRYFAQAGMPMDAEPEGLRLLPRVFVLGGLALWGAAFLLVRCTMRVMRRSSDALAARIEKLDPLHTPGRLLVAPDAEQASLVESLNGLLARLAEAQRVQQQFVAEASHELRTPLTILLGENDVALRRERTATEYREILVSNREEMARLAKVVENLLALARSEAGESEPGREAVNLHTLCGEVCDQLGPLAEEKKVALTLAPCPTDPVLCPGDAPALQRVVFNLVENALAATPAGEAIRVEVDAEGERGRIRVIDHGVGIAREHLARLFDRFFRTPASKARNPDGAGLGLAIVKSIVEAHGGTVEATSVPGQGSTFTVLLPGRTCDKA